MSRTLTRVLFALMCISTTGTAATTHFYVATNGNDHWTGARPDPASDRADGPFASLQRARDAIRAHRKASAAPCAYTVSIRGGVHLLEETVAFRPEDSGTAEHPVTYQAFEGERAILSGGRPITEWTRGTGARKQLLTARIEPATLERPVPNELFVNGQRRLRAQTWLRSAGRSRSLAMPRQSLRFNPGDFARWDNLEDVLIRAYSSWITTLHWIQELDLERRVVTFTNKGWEFGRFDAHQRYIIENCLEALDTPGEWFIDRSGQVTYWPLPGEAVSAVIPVVRERLVEFAGDPKRGRYVQHLIFRGLTFQHVGWTIKRESRYDHQDYAALPWAAVFAIGLRGSRIEDCEICNIGVHGIYLLSGCADNAVVRCHVHDTGGGGIYIGSRASASDGNDAVTGNLVHNCFVHDVGRVFGGSVGIYLGRGARNTISHNEVCNTDWSGISLGNPGKPDSADNVVEFNHIHHVLRHMLSDGAGIYTLGTSPGTVIRSNLIHDAYAYPACPARGIYHDTMSDGYTCENNVVYNVCGHGILLCGQAERITVRNNVFAKCGRGGAYRVTSSSAFKRNIVYLRDARAMVGRTPTAASPQIDHNLYWLTDQPVADARFGGRDFATWQSEGRDRHSRVADPMFVDPEAHDYRLRDDSPAFELGFKPVDPRAAGLQRDGAWTSLPARSRSGAAPLPTFPPRPPFTISDDFEQGTVGALPGCMAHVAELKGRIRISDEAAATGSQSVKVTDAPGMKGFYPYMYDQSIRVDSGTVTLSVDLMQDPDSPGVPQLQLRDYETPRTNAAAGGPRAHRYAEGPVVALTAEGWVSANGERVVRVPAGEWVRITLTFELGPGAPRTYRIEAHPLAEPDRKATAKAPFASAYFTVFTGLFITTGIDPPDSEPVFFLDNLKTVQNKR